MLQTNPNIYLSAARHIEAGGWQVDPVNGWIIGAQGKPLTRLSPDGYVHPKFREPGNWTSEVSVFAHRVIWEYVNGPIPEGMTINHLNGVKADNRIANLELASVGDNVRHAVATGLRLGRKGVTSPKAILTDTEVRSIYNRCKTERVADIARDHDVAYWTVSSIKFGRNWAHITGHGCT